LAVGLALLPFLKRKDYCAMTPEEIKKRDACLVSFVSTGFFFISFFIIYMNMEKITTSKKVMKQFGQDSKEYHDYYKNELDNAIINFAD